MNRIDRLFGISVLLQSGKSIFAGDIAERFNISERTVYRDLKALCEQGIPITFDVNKGYSLVQGYFLPPIAFDTEEANALMLMEMFVNGFADKSIKQHYMSALDKVRAVLKHAQKEKFDYLQQQTKFQIPECITNDTEHLALLQLAISTKKILLFEYQDASKALSERKVEPIGLIFYAFSWHLIAWCHLRSAYRDFKVSRIVNILNTDAPFSKNQHIALADYMKNLPVAY